MGASKIAKGAAAAPRFAMGRLLWPLAAVRAGRAVHAHWQSRLTPRQRRQTLALLRASRGRPSRLTRRQRKQLHGLLDTLGPVALLRNAAIAASPIPAAPKRKLLRR